MDNEFLAGKGEQEAAEGLAEAQAMFNSARRQLFGIIQDVEEGNGSQVKRLQPLLAELRRATWTIHEERKKADEERKRELGIVHGYALDFDAARDEIKRRMARLRAAEDPGGVPGQSE